MSDMSETRFGLITSGLPEDWLPAGFEMAGKTAFVLLPRVSHADARARIAANGGGLPGLLSAGVVTGAWRALDACTADLDGWDTLWSRAGRLRGGDRPAGAELPRFRKIGPNVAPFLMLPDMASSPVLVQVIDHASLGRRGADDDALDLAAIALSLRTALADLHSDRILHLGIGPHCLDLRAPFWLGGAGINLRALATSLDAADDIADLRHAPPELFDLSRRSPIGPWSDIYMASSTLFELTTGAPPPPWYERGDDAADQRWLAARLATSPAEQTPWLVDIIVSGLRLPIRQRPQTVAGWGIAMPPPRAASVPKTVVSAVPTQLRSPTLQPVTLQPATATQTPKPPINVVTRPFAAEPAPSTAPAPKLGRARTLGLVVGLAAAPLLVAVFAAKMSPTPPMRFHLFNYMAALGCAVAALRAMANRRLQPGRLRSFAGWLAGGLLLMVGLGTVLAYQPDMVESVADIGAPRGFLAMACLLLVLCQWRQAGLARLVTWLGWIFASAALIAAPTAT